jgi:hypothetical protein
MKNPIIGVGIVLSNLNYYLEKILNSVPVPFAYLILLTIFILAAFLFILLWLFVLNLVSKEKHVTKELVFVSLSSSIGTIAAITGSYFLSPVLRYMYFPFTWFFLFLIFITVVFFVQTKMIQHFTQRKNKGDFILSFVALIFSTAGIISTAFFLMDYQDPCWDILYRDAGAFNQHIKDLCYLREDTSECPQNVEQLKAFSASRYQKVKQCADVEYYFNEKTQNYELRLSPYIKKSQEIIFPMFANHEEVLLKNLNQQKEASP